MAIHARESSFRTCRMGVLDGNTLFGTHARARCWLRFWLPSRHDDMAGGVSIRRSMGVPACSALLHSQVYATKERKGYHAAIEGAALRAHHVCVKPAWRESSKLVRCISSLLARRGIKGMVLGRFTFLSPCPFSAGICICACRCYSAVPFCCASTFIFNFARTSSPILISISQLYGDYELRHPTGRQLLEFSLFYFYLCHSSTDFAQQRLLASTISCSVCVVLRWFIAAGSSDRRSIRHGGMEGRRITY
mmetsp:Transcript_36513/g.94864  ORF Transcript_36513/g.94864 Transcript_36513/m.94864 type:complete len:249 (+) Transcript_36513:100-846(+)